MVGENCICPEFTAKRWPLELSCLSFFKSKNWSEDATNQSRLKRPPCSTLDLPIAPWWNDLLVSLSWVQLCWPWLVSMVGKWIALVRPTIWGIFASPCHWFWPCCGYSPFGPWTSRDHVPRWSRRSALLNGRYPWNGLLLMISRILLRCWRWNS